ncbi:MAG: aminotransferase class V-fold PLP-dependent enzyme, partial [Candidatus Diapherotrites archaeon]
MNVEQIRKDFPLLKRKDSGKQIIYFDNAATSLKPEAVLDALVDYYSRYTANIHRGVHKMSQEASEKYEMAHRKVGKFINAKHDEIIFTRNATESFNLLMYGLYNQKYFSSGDEILISAMEHHANIVPWQFLE